MSAEALAAGMSQEGVLVGVQLGKAAATRRQGRTGGAGEICLFFDCETVRLERRAGQGAVDHR